MAVCADYVQARPRWHERLVSILLVLTVLVIRLPAAGPARTTARAAQSEETVRILGMPGARLRRQSSTLFTLIEHHDVGQSADNAELPYELEVSVLRNQLRGGAAKNGTARPPVSTGLPLPGRKAAFTPDGELPEAGSREFDALCGPQLSKYGRAQLGVLRQLTSAAPASAHHVPKKVLAVSGPTESEGVADFMTRSLLAAACAIGTGAGLHLSWSGVDLSRVLIPNLIDWSSGGAALEATCNASRSCEVVHHFGQSPGECEPPSTPGFSAALPLRSAYHIDSAAVGSAAEYWPPWPMHADVAAGCVLSVLYTPAASLASRVGRFDVVRRALRDPNTLSIAIYVRSFDSESLNQQMSDAALDGATLPPRTRWTAAKRRNYAQTAACALELERRWGPGFKRIVWYVAGDNVALRNSLAAEFDETSIGGRAVLSSGSHGRHSRPRSSPSQGSTKYELSVLEALADWWLLGEADLGVLGAFDYGGDHGVGSYATSAFARAAKGRSVFGNVFGKHCSNGESDFLPMWPVSFKSASAGQRAGQPLQTIRPGEVERGDLARYVELSS